MKKDIEWLRNEIEALREVDMSMLRKWKNSSLGERHAARLTVIKEVLGLLNELDEPEAAKNNAAGRYLQVMGVAIEQPKTSVIRLNNRPQESYIVPLGLKTTDGEDQYLTYNGSYFASRRNKFLQQTFDTLEEIPEPYRGLAERCFKDGEEHSVTEKERGRNEKRY